MTFGAAIKHGFKNLTNFTGRARRSEFWWFYLFVFLISLPLSFLATLPMIGAFITAVSNADPVTGEFVQADANRVIGATLTTLALSFLLSAFTFFLMLAVWVRRLHDAGYSGHWLWLTLAGLSIVPLIFAFFDSVQGPNQWGEDPKAAERPNAWAAAPQAYAVPPVAPVPPVTAAPPATAVPPATAASADPTDPFARPS